MILSLTGCTSDSEVPKSLPVKPVASDAPTPLREVKRIPLKLSATPLTKSFKGISLGMTLVQLKKIHPKIDADDLIVDSDFCDCSHRFDQPNDCPHVYGCGEDLPLKGDDYYKFKAIFVCGRLAKFEFELLPIKLGMPFLNSCRNQYGPPGWVGKDSVSKDTKLVWQDPSTKITVTENFLNGRSEEDGSNFDIAISDTRLIELSEIKRLANHAKNSHLQEVANNPPYEAKIKRSFRLSESAAAYVDFVTADTPTQLAMAERGYNLDRPTALENEIVTVQEITTDRNFDMVKIKTLDGQTGWLPRDAVSLPIR